MQALLTSTFASLSLDEAPRRLWEPALPLLEAALGGRAEGLLECIDSEARAVALDRRLTLTEVLAGLAGGAEALRGGLVASGDPRADEACRRLMQLEQAMFVRAAAGYAAGLQEIIVRLELEAETRSSRDPLTGALKPDKFVESLAREVTRCQRMDLSLGLAALTLGDERDAGGAYAPPADRLRLVGGVLKKSLRSYDTVGRSETGDFLVALPDVSRSGLMSAAERLRRELDDEAQVTPGARHLFALAHFDYVDLPAADMVAMLQRGVERVRNGDDYVTWS
jgi:GGDEF domain-containing protein